MTLDQELEIDLLGFVAKGFDLPLVIGEQFICTVSGKTFQSASYTDCLEYILTTLYHDGHQFAVDIWDELIKKLNHEPNYCVMKCRLAFHGFSCETRKSHFHEYQNCFVGKQAVSWLVGTRICVSDKPREEAVELANEWVQRGFIKHVDNAGRDFEDEKGVFYEFDQNMILKEMRRIREALREAMYNEMHKKGMSTMYNDTDLHELHDVSPQQMKGTPSSSNWASNGKDVITYNDGKFSSMSPIKKKRSLNVFGSR